MGIPEKDNDLEATLQQEMTDIAETEVDLASHTPVLDKSFDLLSACATGITTGNAWAVLGGGALYDTLVFFLHHIMG